MLNYVPRKHLILDIFPALRAFDLDSDINANVLMWDPDNAPISIENFGLTVAQYMNCNSFHIKLAIVSDTDEDGLTLVS